jgi:hypothetical protein
VFEGKIMIASNAHDVVELPVLDLVGEPLCSPAEFRHAAAIRKVACMYEDITSREIELGLKAVGI